MCLNTITRVIENPTLDEVVAWKVFKLLPSGTLMPEYQGYKLKTDTWLKSSRVLIRSDELIDADIDATGLSVSAFLDRKKYKHYNSGFHCYTTYEDAVRHTINWFLPTVVRQVRVRQVHTYGTQYAVETVSCLVAYEMYIPSEQPVQQESKDNK